MHDYEETIHYVLPCFVFISLSLFIQVDLGSQLFDGRKHPIGGVDMTSDLEERS
jgi:hypothetical protein